MIFIGIDPGKKGGISTISDVSKHTVSYSNEELLYVCKFVKQNKLESLCTVELVHAMPRDGVKASFSFGESVGYIKGVLESFGIPYQLVSPQAWKKEYSLIGKDKQASIDCAKRLFPTVNLKPTERSKKDSDGIAESLLICEYGRRKHEGKTK